MAQSIASPELWKVKQNINLSNSFTCNVCRLCANICDNAVPIFDKVNEKGSIYSKLKKCLPSILLLENDSKPKQICLSCVSKLDICFSFIEMSLDADCKLEAALQNRIIPQIQVINDNLLNNKSIDLSWLQVKQESSWNEVKDLQGTRNEQKLPVPSVPELPSQILQHKSFQHAIAQLPVSTSNQYNLPDESNLSMLLNKQDANHNIVQSLVVPDSISSQDLIVFVELKCKDSPSTSPNVKKNDLIEHDGIDALKANELGSYQTKIMDTGGNIRVINLPDFDGKFNQSDKVTSSFINDDNAVTNTAAILKAFESEVLNGVLKLDNLGGENMNSLNETLKSTQNTQNFDNMTIASTSNVESIRPPQQPPTRDFCCNVCGKQFTRRNRLNAHLARHSSLRPHSCDKCDQRFITRWDLTLHLRIHSGVFSCEYCGKAFPAKGKLDRHRRTHTGERPFPCARCNKAFSEKRNLENHLKTHNVATTRKANSIHMCLSCGLHFINASSQSTKCDSCLKKESAVLNTYGTSNKDVPRTDNDLSKNDVSASVSNDTKNNLADVTSSTVADFLKT